jgi:hypothetical protein
MARQGKPLPILLLVWNFDHSLSAWKAADGVDDLSGPDLAAASSDLGHEGKGRLNCIGDRSGTSALRIHKNPVGFPAHENLLVRRAKEFVTSQRSDAAEVDHPGQRLDLVPQEGRGQILHVMRPCHPAGAGVFGGLHAESAIEMVNGEVLHPLDPDDIVHMTIRIDGALRNHDDLPEDSGWQFG